jgi:hypothetical protein
MSIGYSLDRILAPIRGATFLLQPDAGRHHWQSVLVRAAHDRGEHLWDGLICFGHDDHQEPADAERRDVFEQSGA